MTARDAGQKGQEIYTVYIAAGNSKAKHDVLRELLLRQYRNGPRTSPEAWDHER